MMMEIKNDYLHYDTKGSGENPRSPFHFNIIDLIERRIQFFITNLLKRYIQQGQQRG
jgi:hypothetical protein